MNNLTVNTGNFMVVSANVFELVKKLPKVQRQNQKALLVSAYSQWQAAKRNDTKELNQACDRLQRVVNYLIKNNHMK